MLKLQRNYYAEFTIKELNSKNNEWSENQIITVAYPTSAQIQIQLGALGGANSATIQFLNLDSSIQALLWRDLYNNGTKQIKISLYAGYQDTMPLVFKGWVQECTSYRNSGATETITNIQAFEGGYLFQYGYINSTISAGTEFKDVLNYMLEGDEDTKLGCVSPDLQSLKKNTTFIGQITDILNRNYAGYNTFVEKGQFHILGNNDVIEGDLQVITDETGLLGTPRRSNIFTEVDLVFEPQFRIGQFVSLVSNNEIIKQKGFNQLYKIVNIRHFGQISPRACGQLRTTVTLAVLPKKYNIVKPAQPTTYDSKNVSTEWDKPVKNGKITSPFGLREKPLPNASTNHSGIDIGADYNTPVYAPANGRVTMTHKFGGYGNTVEINNGLINGKTVTSLFGHLSSWAVKPGETVYKGQTILGYVGSTGVSTGPHLHFEIKENGQPVNPTKYIGNY